MKIFPFDVSTPQEADNYRHERVDTERPHELRPGEIHEFYQSYINRGPISVEGIQVCNREGNGTSCGQPRNAAVHQVAKGPCRECGETVFHNLFTCKFVFGRDKSLCRDVPVRDAERTFAPAEVHQTPARTSDEYRKELGLPSLSPPPDQHVAPPRSIWIDAADDPADRCILETAMPVESGFTEYRPIAPIQAALETCEREALHPDGRISFRRLDYDALVAAVKGEK